MAPKEHFVDVGHLPAGPSTQGGAFLQIDLGNLSENYVKLDSDVGGAECAAVVKSDAYGLGIHQVAPVLTQLGCRTFFVAHLDEGISLRSFLRQMPDLQGEYPEIFILHGIFPGTENEFLAHRLTPVLNTMEQLDFWAQKSREQISSTGPLDAAVQLDTGMNRLGLTVKDATLLAKTPGRLRGLNLKFWLSHLACAEQPDHPKNNIQRQLFEFLLASLPTALKSLANSSAIFLGTDYHYDLTRPGFALFGGNPTPLKSNPMKEVVSLRSSIIQIREIDAFQTVGYGAKYEAPTPRRIATIPVGYADGYLRSLSEQGMACLAGVLVPIVGRISMDLITIDISDVPEHATHTGAVVELIGGRGETIDKIASRAGTIGYEIMTSLGQRYRRTYVNNVLSEA